MLTVRIVLCSAFLFVASCSCLAQLPKPVECPAGRTYTDNRDVTGGSVFASSLLPGSLEVRDGPFRFWFNPKFEGSTGSYKLGREFGKWKECKSVRRLRSERLPGTRSRRKAKGWRQARDSDHLYKRRIPLRFRYLPKNINGAYRRRCDRFDELAYEPDGCHYDYSTRKDIVFHDDLQALQLGHPKQRENRLQAPFSVGQRGRCIARSDERTSPAGSAPVLRRDEVSSGAALLSRRQSNRRDWSGVSISATYDVGNNGVGIGQARLHFQKNAASRANRCVVRYDPVTRNFYLNSDEPGKYLGPMAAGGSDSLWNKECLLAACSNAQLVSTTLTVKFAIRFNPAEFSGTHEIYMELVDTQKHATPAGSNGEWTVPADESVSSGTPWPSDQSCPVASAAPQ